MKTAKLFTTGRSQAVRLPQEFRFKGDEVYIHDLGGAVVLIPKGDPWGPLIRSLDMFPPDFMEERNQGEQPQRESFD